MPLTWFCYSVPRMVACTHSPGSAHKPAPDWWCFALIFQNQLSTQNTKNYRLYKHGKILCVFFVDCVSTSSVRTTSAVNRPPVSVCHERVGSDKNNMQISWAFVSAHATGWKARRRVTPPEDDASPPSRWYQLFATPSSGGMWQLCICRCGPREPAD